MRLSILLPTNLPYASLADQSRRIEDAGLAGIWVPDHLSGGTFFPEGTWKGSISVLSHLLASTERIRVGLLVASAVLRPAPTLALELSSLRASGRQIVCGIGRGAERDAACTGRALASSMELAAYARAVAREGIDVVVAANGEQSIQAARTAGGGWVTTGGYHVTGDEKTNVVERLMKSWQGNPEAGDSYVLVDPFEPSPFASESALTAALRLWHDLRVDELVVWNPESYAEGPGIDYMTAASCLSAFNEGIALAHADSEVQR